MKVIFYLCITYVACEDFPSIFQSSVTVFFAYIWYARTRIAIHRAEVSLRKKSSNR